jgi:GDPmannose 4,6-dehydratase
LKVGDIKIRVDRFYYRPTEVDLLVGDATKAKEKLGWTPTHDVASLCKEMVKSDLEIFQRIALLKREGFEISNEYE